MRLKIVFTNIQPTDAFHSKSGNSGCSLMFRSNTNANYFIGGGPIFTQIIFSVLHIVLDEFS